MTASASVLASLMIVTALVVAGCGASGAASCPASGAKAQAAPKVALTADDKEVWKPLPPDRATVPVLVYHGIGTPSDFSNTDDAAFGVAADDFAKQMTLMKHAGYQTIDLTTFVRFIEGKSVDLPARPLLLTFDDGRRDSWTGADSILAKLGFNAVMFVDTGRVDACDKEYLTWDDLQQIQDTGRWQLQNHAGPHGHSFIQYGSDKDETGPFYSYEDHGEGFDGWRDRVRDDIDLGNKALADHISGYVAQSFALPYGSYGQDGTNDERIPDDLLAYLTDHYNGLFTLDAHDEAQANTMEPLGRIPVTRSDSGGDLYEALTK